MHAIFQIMVKYLYSVEFSKPSRFLNVIYNFYALACVILLFGFSFLFPCYEIWIRINWLLIIFFNKKEVKVYCKYKKSMRLKIFAGGFGNSSIHLFANQFICMIICPSNLFKTLVGIILFPSKLFLIYPRFII